MRAEGRVGRDNGIAQSHPQPHILNYTHQTTITSHKTYFIVSEGRRLKCRPACCSVFRRPAGLVRRV